MTALVGRSAGQATQGRPQPPLHRPQRASIGVWVRPPKGTGSQILTVGVMNHPAVRLSSRDRHRQCALDQFGLHVRRHRPTDDVAAPGVEHHRQIQPASPRGHVREVKSRVVCKSERKLLDASVRLPWRPPWARAGVRRDEGEPGTADQLHGFAAGQTDLCLPQCSDDLLRSVSLPSHPDLLAEKLQTRSILTLHLVSFQGVRSTFPRSVLAPILLASLISRVRLCVLSASR